MQRKGSVSLHSSPVCWRGWGTQLGHTLNVISFLLTHQFSHTMKPKELYLRLNEM